MDDAVALVVHTRHRRPAPMLGVLLSRIFLENDENSCFRIRFTLSCSFLFVAWGMLGLLGKIFAKISWFG